ncbi:MAG: right-handed parallel beta-helix repeat-containing protein [Sedimentisphaerales bacterium]|nr:right-handed parallel beta-helix repeat-containing protein [Sedimentisphaerales bacterium]
MTRQHFLILCFLSIGMAGFLPAATLTVDDSGGQPYTSIQDAINDANPGDTVYVFPGTYAEQIVMQDGVNLTGYSPHNTTIDGQGTAVHVVTYDGAEPATLSGFRIIGSATSSAGGTWHYGGVYCQVGPLTIRNNIIEDNKAGIAVETEGRPSIINNTIINNTNGIIFASSYTPYTPPQKVAFIFDTNLTLAKEYAELLGMDGIDVDLIPLEEVAKYSLNQYRAILIGTDTGDGDAWGTPQVVARIAESGKPILAMGEGGYAFLGKLQLATGYPHGSHSGTNTDMYVMDPEHLIYLYPNPISIPKSGILSLYTRSGSVEINLNPIPRNVEVLGRFPDSPYHYLLTRENQRYMFWGFTGTGGALTEVGAELFLNVVRYLMITCYPNLPDPELVATGSELIGEDRIRYEFRVDNWFQYPDELFEPAPDLPPCGINPNASRTDVNIHAEDGTQLYGFCAIPSAGGLTYLWFGHNAGEEPPQIYIEMIDRRCGVVWQSNLVTPQIEPRITHTIMNNIIVNNTTGIFYYAYTGDGQILYNDVWGNSYRNYHDNSTASTFMPSPGTGQISADPLFDPEYPGFYYLTDESPCKDTGNPAPSYNDPDGTRNDMGVWGGPEAGGPTTHPGSGFIFTNIGNIPTSEIVQDSGNPSHGLAVVDPSTASDLAIPAYLDAPFGATLRIHGLFGDVDIANGLRYYQILIAQWPDENTPPDPADYEPITTALHKVRYLPQPDGTVLTEVVQLGPKEVGGVANVYELTYNGWWSSIDLRILLNTRSLANGKYTLTYKAYRPVSIYPIGTILLQMALAPNDLDHLTILVNNSPVEAIIHNVKYDPSSPNWDSLSDGEIPECGIISLQNDTENLRFTITAQHPDGYLRHWILDAIWGKNHYAGVIAQDTYPGTVPPDDWPGVINQEFNSADGSLTPWERCAYQFRLRAWTRATNGYGYLTSTVYNYSDEFNDHYFLEFSDCGWCGGADVNRSGRVDLGDLARVAAEWLNECGPECPAP